MYPATCWCASGFFFFPALITASRRTRRPKYLSALLSLSGTNWQTFVRIGRRYCSWCQNSVRARWRRNFVLDRVDSDLNHAAVRGIQRFDRTSQSTGRARVQYRYRTIGHVHGFLKSSARNNILSFHNPLIRSFNQFKSIDLLLNLKRWIQNSKCFCWTVNI